MESVNEEDGKLEIEHVSNRATFDSTAVDAHVSGGADSSKIEPLLGESATNHATDPYSS